MRPLVNVLYVAFMVMLLSACNKNDEAANSMTGILSGGKWIITHFSDKGHEATGKFSGYSFKFHQNGQLFVSYAGVDREASWVNIVNSNTLIINLGPRDITNEPLGHLTADWVIVSRSANKVNLKDNNNSELLEFSLH